jgi:hypothetical protein
VLCSPRRSYDSGWSPGSVTIFIPGLHGKRGKHDSSHTMLSTKRTLRNENRIGSDLLNKDRGQFS